MEMPTPPKRSYSVRALHHAVGQLLPPRQLAAATPRSPGGPRLTETVEYTRNKLRALRLQPRKAGTGSRVRAEAITAIVNFYYGPQRKVSVTDAFLELLISFLEDPKGRPRDSVPRESADAATSERQ